MIELLQRKTIAIKNNFLSHKNIRKYVKAEIVKRVVKPTPVYSSESWTLTKGQSSRTNSIEMEFFRKIEGKTRNDKIRTEAFKEQLSERFNRIN